ncbi:hypothetical protein [Kitasatospora sp. MY 5-36]|uniref:hypothetical protein n=1 Tax=Kitasatospora sp. MY 5-36 TaxID=1678027 RepID=UPI00067137E2|nr:hypothetical protein [Kitasatospora sp. MY 5-36]
MPQLGRRLRFLQSLRFTLGLAPTGFAASRETGDPALEHALAGPATLCGIPRRRVTVYRHPFVARKRRGSCPRCRAKAADAPSGP